MNVESAGDEYREVAGSTRDSCRPSYGAPRRPFGDAGDELTERIGMASRLPETDRAAIAHIIDGLLANNRIRQGAGSGRPPRNPPPSDHPWAAA